MDGFPKDAGQYLPHKHPMLFINEITAVYENGGVVTAKLEEGSLLLDENGIMIREGYAELAAQGYGAIRGYEESANGRKHGKGFLVAVQDFKIFKNSKTGDRLTIDLHITGAYEGFYVVQAEIRNNGDIHAAGKIKLFTD